MKGHPTAGHNPKTVSDNPKYLEFLERMAMLKKIHRKSGESCL
jgi:hypothetical protein